MKYVTPKAEKFEFNYAETVVASSIEVGHGDIGVGIGHGGGCDHEPGHDTPHKPHPVFPDGKP